MPAHPPSPPPPPPTRARGQLTAEQFIERQLSKTRTQVKLVDMAATLMTLAAGVLAYLLVVAWVDHWLFDLGFWGRLSSLALLVGGVVSYFAARVMPLLMLSINPVYAARAIEQSVPTLKNSLINLLMFRNQRSAVNDLVYQALEVKAASDLTHVPADTAVDRSQVIRVGYVLAGILACAALYTIVSPKNPLQTVSRVVAPWSNIERPARVEIQEVLPGDATIFQGSALDVAAQIQGVKPADQVTVVYSTSDQQVVGQTVAMQRGANGLRYECVLPPGENGCQQDLVYRVEAGDAVSPAYRVTVSPAPTIVVASVEYDFPEYTGRADQTIQLEGDINALEGTRVTIRARTNQTIRSAQLEFDPSGQGDSAGQAADRLPLEFSQRTAWGSFTLQLAADRRTPVHNSYQLRFVTPEGHSSQQPVLHRIEVIPDLGPEIEVLTPLRIRTKVPANGRQGIEIRAVDPDYGLSRVRLRAIAGGSELLDQVLFEQPAGQLGQTVVNYEFQPASHQLAAGDRVIFWGVAEDNRMAASGTSEPNSQRTQNYELLIVSADAPSPGGAEASPDPRVDDEGARDSSQPPDTGGEQGGAGGTSTGESSKSESAEAGDHSPDQPSESDPGAEQSGEQQSGSQKGGSTASDSSDQGHSAEGPPGTGQPGAGQEQSGAATPSDTAGPSESANRREPLHDGEVFEKALERLRQQQQDQPDRAGDQPGSGQAGDRQSPGDGTSRSPAGNAGQEQGPAGPQDGTNLKDPNGQAGDAQAGSRDPTGEPPDEGGPQQPDVNQGAGSQKRGAPGEGGTSGKQGAEPDRGEKPQVPGQPDQREKDPGIGDSGDAGAGQNSRDTTGAGSVDMSQDQPVENRDRNKTMSPDSSEPQRQGDPGATNSRRQSDTEGGASGDQSGGGEKGPGQGADQAGNDSAGRNSSSDDGAGASQESGVGETADSPGQKQRADRQTGSTGTERGSGSGAKADPQGQRSGKGPDASQRPQTDPDQVRPDQRRGGDQGGGTGQPRGGGVPSDSPQNADLEKDLDVPPGDEANLEYARRATNLVLERLTDQQDKPDERLLNELGWTRDDLREFLARWQQLRDQARQDPAGRREWDETLRSLGLRPRRDRLRQGDSRTDRLEGLRESGDESAPPPAYQRQYKAFKKGSNEG